MHVRTMFASNCLARKLKFDLPSLQSCNFIHFHALIKKTTQKLFLTKPKKHFRILFAAFINISGAIRTVSGFLGSVSLLLSGFEVLGLKQDLPVNFIVSIFLFLHELAAKLENNFTARNAF